MKNVLKLSLVALVLFRGFLSIGQNSHIVKGDDEFLLKNYVSAIECYNKALKSGKDTYDAYLINKKIGDCYLAMNQYAEASSYYENYLNVESKPDKEVLSTYAKLLLNTGQISLAQEQFAALLKQYPEDEELTRLVACCNYAASQLAKPNKKPVKSQELINSPQSEFGLAFFNNDLIFASKRLNDVYTTIDGRTSQGFSDYYIAKYDPQYKMYTDPVPLKGEINTAYNDGTFAYSPKSSTAFLTQCVKNPEYCQIYKARYEKDKWIHAEPVPIGEAGYNYAHPALTSDGKTIYFTSDMPGGQGGKDIWKAKVSPAGNITNPENLGDVINTREDEMFPYVLGDSVLFFSSSGHIGMGGLDIFYSKIKRDLFEKPVNAEVPINSTGDDFSIILNNDLNGGYFCSNRNNAEQSDDIYAFFHNLFLKDLFGRVIDSLTLNPVKDVKINYLTGDKAKSIVYSDSLGRFEIPNSAHAGCKVNHTLIFEKEGYITKEMGAPCHSEKEILVFMSDISGGLHTLTGHVFDKNSGLPIDQALVTLSSLKGLQDTTFTDPDGFFKFEKIPMDDYIILRAFKEGYLSDSKVVKAPYSSKPVEMSTKTGYDTDFNLFPNKPNVEYKIENIYYEFDKANLLPESKASLNILVNLLNENPQIKVQISSHTDERGTDKYNQNLSERRGASVVEYLTANGISNERLISRGYGETMLAVLHATTEEEHQVNRRTTFKIVGEMQGTVANSSLSGQNQEDADQHVFKEIRSTIQSGTPVNEQNFMDIKIKAGLDNKPETVVEAESGEIFKITDGKLVRAVPEPVEREKPAAKTAAFNQERLHAGFRIQIAASGQKVTMDKQFSNIEDLVDRYGLNVEEESGMYKYRIGNFVTRDEAVKVREIIRKRGLQNCFIIGSK